MSTSSRLLRRLDRVLALAEQWLRDATGAPPDSDVFARAIAFRWEGERGAGRLVSIDDPAHFDLHDLVGVDGAIERLLRNTEQFVSSLPANHVLLHGERGTGKSSAVRGLLSRFADRGLRLVEVHKADLTHLPRILAALRPAPSGLRFVIFCDDLSFGPAEPGFRELKAALEGSVEAAPHNVLLVATSNRRHLLPESMADNRAATVDEHGELHLGEALEEKLALSDRFGLVLGFYAFDQDTYLEAVRHYLEREQLGVSLEEVRAAALRWALQRDSRSGRTARQFVTDLAGRRGLEARR